MSEFHRQLARNAGLPFIDDPDPVPDSALSPAAARSFGVVPILDDGAVLGVATCDPAHVDIDALGALVDRRIEIAVSTPEAIEDALRALDRSTPKEPELQLSDPPVTQAPPQRHTTAAAGTGQGLPPDADIDCVGMSSDSFGRSFRGYRRGEVDSAMARHADELARLTAALGATEARANAMQVEIRDLHSRLDALREREASATRALDEMRERREQMDRDAHVRAEQFMLEAKERATLLKSEGLRQVGELQIQVEQLLGMRAGLTQALQRLSEDMAAAMARLAASPATSIDRPVEHHVERWADGT